MKRFGYHHQSVWYSLQRIFRIMPHYAIRCLSALEPQTIQRAELGPLALSIRERFISTSTSLAEASQRGAFRGLFEKRCILDVGRRWLEGYLQARNWLRVSHRQATSGTVDWNWPQSVSVVCRQLKDISRFMWGPRQ